MLTAKINNNLINCYDGKYSKEELKSWASKDIIKYKMKKILKEEGF